MRDTDSTPNGPSSSNDPRVERLLAQLTKTYRTSGAFRRGLTARRIEVMLPTIADFAAVSSSSDKPDNVKPQRDAALQWLSAIIEFSKLPSPLITQVSLCLSGFLYNRTKLTLS